MLSVVTVPPFVFVRHVEDGQVSDAALPKRYVPVPKETVDWAMDSPLLNQ